MEKIFNIKKGLFVVIPPLLCPWCQISAADGGISMEETAALAKHGIIIFTLCKQSHLRHS